MLALIEIVETYLCKLVVKLETLLFVFNYCIYFCCSVGAAHDANVSSAGIIGFIFKFSNRPTARHLGSFIITSIFSKCELQ